MHIVMGAGGHVGGACARELLSRGEQVTVVLHSKEESDDWKSAGAGVAIVDVYDARELHEVLLSGDTFFALNPPAKPSTDVVTLERRTASSIAHAIAGTDLKRVVLESTYGAQSGERIGDLGVLFEFEQAVLSQHIPVSIIRAAYYMSNWDASLQSACDEGVVRSLYAPDFKLPMVAPADLGQAAADLLTGSFAGSGPHYVEGPHRYSTQDVAHAFESALNTPVRAEEIARSEWTAALKGVGFSDLAAESFIGMALIIRDRRYAEPDVPVRGAISLQQYIQGLCRKACS